MKDFIPYAIGIVIGVLALALIQTQCEPPKPEVVVRIDTVKGDSIKVIVTRPLVVEKIVYRNYPVPTDDSPCWGMLKAAYLDMDSIATVNWYLSELETEAKIEQGHVSGTIGWSTPRFLNKSTEGFFYDLRSTVTETHIYPERPRGFWDRFGYGPVLGLGVGTQGPDVFIGVGGFFDIR
jgi:hypothetical protein